MISMLIREQKKLLRKKMLRTRSEMDPQDKAQHDRRLVMELEKLIVERDFQVIHAYIPMAGEIDIAPLLLKLLEWERCVICPKTLSARRLENRKLKNMEALETGIMGTRHPLHADVYEGPIDLVIVPGLAVDVSHYRLGYGGAYYDTFLAKQPAAYKLGIFYPFQLVESVPLEVHDYRLDQVMLAY